jgi:glycosyltransferase involved in cell wall biosynthesis
MRIAFILSALGAGGAERVIATIAQAAVEQGWDAAIITFDRPDDPIYHAIDPRVRLIRLALPMERGGWSALATTVRRVRALRRTLAGQFDLVVSFLTKINALTLLATRGTGARVIVSERNNPNRQPSHPLWQWALRHLYPRAAAIVVQTERAKQCLPAADAERAVVIPNAAPRLPFAPLANGALRLVAVGRLTEQKGFDLLIPAFAQIAKDHPAWTLTIFGDGPKRAELEAQVEAAKLSTRVSLPGSTPRPGEWISVASLFVLSSRYEGFPNVLGEAMRAGLPVIAFDCDFGPADLIEPGISGLLVAPEDVAALAASLDAAMASAELRTRLGRGAACRAARFDPATVLDQWMQLFEQLSPTTMPIPVQAIESGGITV